MAEEKESTSIPLSQTENASPGNISDPEDAAKSPPNSPNYSTRRMAAQNDANNMPGSNGTLNNQYGISNLRVIMGEGHHIVEHIYGTITCVFFVGTLTLELGLSNRPELGLIQETSEFFCTVYLPPGNPPLPGPLIPDQVPPKEATNL